MCVCVNVKTVSMNTLSKTPQDALVGYGPHDCYWCCEDTDLRKTVAATGFLDSRAHTNEPESITDPMV